jgi:hypothetical protein
MIFLTGHPQVPAPSEGCKPYIKDDSTGVEKSPVIITSTATDIITSTATDNQPMQQPCSFHAHSCHDDDNSLLLLMTTILVLPAVPLSQSCHNLFLHDDNTQSYDAESHLLF